MGLCLAGVLFILSACGPSAEDELARGITFFEHGQFDEAAVAFKSASVLEPESPVPHNNLGIVYVTRGLYDEAIGAYQKAIKLDSKNAEPHFNLGNAYSTLKRVEDAAESYRQAVHLAPERGEIHYNLAATYYDLDRFDLAWKHVQLASQYGADGSMADHLERALEQITDGPLKLSAGMEKEARE